MPLIIIPLSTTSEYFSIGILSEGGRVARALNVPDVRDTFGLIVSARGYSEIKLLEPSRTIKLGLGKKNTY